MLNNSQPVIGFSALEDLQRALHKALAKTGLIVSAVYLHGSYATPYERDESDIDIAVLSERALSLDEQIKFSVALQNELEGRDVDLADLHRVNTVFAAQIVTSGRRVITINPEIADRFEMLTLSKYVRLNEERAEILADIKQRGRIFNTEVSTHE
jgi:predicted nucleotidyltransferase